MKNIYIQDQFVPDIIGTGCMNSYKVKDVPFPIPCGKCIPCQKKRRRDWSYRLQCEFNTSDSAHFITLTYDDIHIPLTEDGQQNLKRKDLQNYIKRIRRDNEKFLSKEYNTPIKQLKDIAKPIRYYAVGEYGSKTMRPHYHIILFNYDPRNLAPILDQWKDTTSNIRLGHVDIGDVTSASINYITKYINKPHAKGDTRGKPYATMSKKPIIGNQYLLDHGLQHILYKDLSVRDNEGNQQRMPRAFLKRLFTDDEKHIIFKDYPFTKEERLETSKSSLDEFQQNKIKEYKRVLENYQTIKQYTDSIKSDELRERQKINHKETL